VVFSRRLSPGDHHEHKVQDIIASNHHNSGEDRTGFFVSHPVYSVEYQMTVSFQEMDLQLKRDLPRDQNQATCPRNVFQNQSANACKEDLR